MPRNKAFRHKYCVKLQCLFSGVEWFVLKDGRVCYSGEASDVETGLASARRAYLRERADTERRARFHA